MNLRTLYLTENECYKTGRKHTVQGIMIHSTGANNPYLKRYVNPDDGVLGKNQYDNHWNRLHPDGRKVCVHAFIGKLNDGNIATYQTLPWDIVGWHSGSGGKGNANNMGYIGFEICEDDLTDSGYASSVFDEAVELCVMLCKKYNLSEKNIICHSEGASQGIASNHADVMHWFVRHKLSMDLVRQKVKEKLTPKLYRVQVGAYKEKVNAEIAWASLTSKGYRDAFLTAKSSNGLYRVQVGAFAVRANAEKLSVELKNRGYDNFIIET